MQIFANFILLKTVGMIAFVETEESVLRDELSSAYWTDQWTGICGIPASQ